MLAQQVFSTPRRDGSGVVPLQPQQQTMSNAARNEPSEEMKNCRRSQALRTVRPDPFLMEKKTLQMIGSPSALAALSRVEMSPTGALSFVGSSSAHQGTENKNLHYREDYYDPSQGLLETDVEFPDTHLSMELSAVEESLEVLDLALQSEGNELAPHPHNRPPGQTSVAASAALGSGNTISLLSYLQHDASDKNAAALAAARTPILAIEVEIAPGHKEPIKVFEDDVCSAVALEFTRKHQLPRAKVWEPLTQFLQRSLDEQMTIRAQTAAAAAAKEKANAATAHDKELAEKKRRQAAELDAPSDVGHRGVGERLKAEQQREQERKQAMAGKKSNYNPTLERLTQLAKPKAKVEQSRMSIHLAQQQREDEDEGGQGSGKRKVKARADQAKEGSSSQQRPTSSRGRSASRVGREVNPNSTTATPSGADIEKLRKAPSTRPPTPSRLSTLSTPRSQQSTPSRRSTPTASGSNATSPAPKPQTQQGPSNITRSRSGSGRAGSSSRPRSSSRGGAPGDRLHALNAERQKKLQAMKEHREQEKLAREQETLQQQPTINRRSQGVESVVRRTLHMDPSSALIEREEDVNVALRSSERTTEAREMQEHCSFRPNINTASSSSGARPQGQPRLRRSSKGPTEAVRNPHEGRTRNPAAAGSPDVVQRLMASQKSADERLAEKRAFLEKRDAKTGEAFFKPKRNF